MSFGSGSDDDSEQVGRCVRVLNNVDFSEIDAAAAAANEKHSDDSDGDDSDVEMKEGDDSGDDSDDGESSDPIGSAVYSRYDTDSTLKALILAPTRELAVQVSTTLS